MVSCDVWWSDAKDCSYGDRKNYRKVLGVFMRVEPEKNVSLSFKYGNALSQAQKEISLHACSRYMAYPAFHDFVALLFVYNDLLKEAANRNMRDKTMDELYHFFCEKDGRVLKYKEYFEKNQVIAEAYRFISGVIQYIKKQNNNPKHKRYLKI